MNVLTEEQVSADIESIIDGDVRRLERFGSKVYSQSDEDGILREIYRRIGTTNRVFVEFGAETGEENNSRLLLETGWKGLWIEGMEDYSESIRARYAREIIIGQLTFTESFVTAENINDLIEQAGIRGEIDFLSVDIDGNDYHVFEAINVVNPRVVCLEHNHTFPPPEDWVMPYDTNYRWEQLGSEYGASIFALNRLACEKGYALVGCGLYSANGFYVRNDLLGDHFSPPYDPERFFRPLDYEKVIGYPARSLDAEELKAKRRNELTTAPLFFLRRLQRKLNPSNSTN